MHGHAGRLVDHDQMGVLEQDGEGDVLRLGDGGDDCWQGDGIEAGQGLGRGGRDGLAIPGHDALGQ